MNDVMNEAPLATGAHHPTKDDFPRGPSEPPLCGECAVERAFREDALAKGWDLDRILAKWTDHPEDQSPTICAALRSFNDRTGESERGQRRRARVADVELRLAMRNTKGSKELERRRQLALADWSLRVAVPDILSRSKSLAHLGVKLAALPEIDTVKAANDASDQLWAVRDECWRVYREENAKLRGRVAAAEAVAAVVAAAVVAAAEAVAVAAEVVVAAAEAVAVAAAEAAEAVAAEAEAAEAVAAEAVAVAAAAVAVAAAAVAAAVAAVAAAVAAAIFGPDVCRRAAEAARKELISGQSWSSQKRAARAVFDKELAKPEHRSTLEFADKHDAEFRVLLLRLCAMR